MTLNPQNKMNRSRSAIALIAAIVLSLLIITPFVLAIHNYDWGVALVFISPLLVWWLMRMGKSLERWARNEPDRLPPDPDFPDDINK